MLNHEKQELKEEKKPGQHKRGHKKGNVTKRNTRLYTHRGLIRQQETGGERGTAESN